MGQKYEAPHKSGATRNSCGGQIHKNTKRSPSVEQAHVAYIKQFVPDAEGAELEYRIALLIARDFAADLLASAPCLRSYDHARDAHEMAGEFLFSVVRPANLNLAVNYCRHSVMCSFMAAHLDRPEQ